MLIIIIIIHRFIAFSYSRKALLLPIVKAKSVDSLGIGRHGTWLSSPVVGIRMDREENKYKGCG